MRLHRRRAFVPQLFSRSHAPTSTHPPPAATRPLVCRAHTLTTRPPIPAPRGLGPQPARPDPPPQRPPRTGPLSPPAAGHICRPRTKPLSTLPRAHAAMPTTCAYTAAPARWVPPPRPPPHPARATISSQLTCRWIDLRPPPSRCVPRAARRATSKEPHLRDFRRAGADPREDRGGEVDVDVVVALVRRARRLIASAASGWMRRVEVG
jgi:hypothetical protein